MTIQAAPPTLHAAFSKPEIVDLFRAHLQAQGLTITQVDAARPWGAFLRVADADADKFIEAYYHGVPLPKHARSSERSPKILLVAPHARLSWQYHDRRSEVWRAVSGPVGVYASPTDAQPAALITLDVGQTIEVAQGTRHRLVGLDAWGAVAEIWIHTDPAHPSDEDDIHRVQDDYARD
ncbi:MAG: phosphoheptose isomerase [Chloroflexi bacterium]|nr:phosphoheptose isomerase [Chloroflexota bacterium]